MGLIAAGKLEIGKERLSHAEIDMLVNAHWEAYFTDGGVREHVGVAGYVGYSESDGEMEEHIDEQDDDDE